MKTDDNKKVLSKFTIFCWATFIAILGCMWSAGRGLDTSAGEPSQADIHLFNKADFYKKHCWQSPI